MINRVKFNVSDETSTLFNCALDYLKREKRLNYLTHWDIQVTGGGGKLRVPPSSMACGCLVQATALSCIISDYNLSGRSEERPERL